jgi:uncharacterized protein YbjT (DUF2867 family)
MRILITGTTGFIGSSLAAALARRGHEVVACTHRRKRDERAMAVDFMRDLDEADWLPRLHGVDAVINAVGILRETRHAHFDALHHRAPTALFRACHTAGVKRVIQISALGADEEATSAYHLSKKAADDELRFLELDWTIVQPSVVFGSGGASTGLFLQLASLPVMPLIGRGEQLMQPVHIDDLTDLIVKLVEERAALRQTLHAVGPRAVTLSEMLRSYRAQLHLGRALLIPIPLPLIRLSAKVGDVVKAGALSTETLDMLLRGNSGDARQIASVLGRPPRALDAFISPAESGLLRTGSVFRWLRPLLLIGIATMWVAAGVASWFYAQDHGLALLAHLGLSPDRARIALAGACMLDVGLGITTLRPNRTIWAMQLAVIGFYTAALTYVAPQLWADPFGPLVKNLPLAVLILGLMSLESER